MEWKDLGLVFEAPTYLEWSESHAQLPVAMQLSGDTYRVFFGTRNEENYTQTGWVDLELADEVQVLDVCEQPVLELGDLGTFDDSGVYPSSVVKDEDGAVRLYYIGWMEGKRVPYYASVGLARGRSDDLEKHSVAPHLCRNDVDPYMTLSSCVRRDGGRWRMWYTSATTWEQYEGGVKPNYHIKYAESEDGLSWEREGHVSIGYEHEDEWAIASPSVVRLDGEWHMWYSYVVGDGAYQIGYARSEDGENWKRFDEEVDLGSDEGWNSGMQAYPNVFQHSGSLYMMYNGDDFGRDGFGLAVADI